MVRGVQDVPCFRDSKLNNNNDTSYAYNLSTKEERMMYLVE